MEHNPKWVYLWFALPFNFLGQCILFLSWISLFCCCLVKSVLDFIGYSNRIQHVMDVAWFLWTEALSFLFYFYPLLYLFKTFLQLNNWNIYFTFLKVQKNVNFVATYLKNLKLTAINNRKRKNAVSFWHNLHFDRRSTMTARFTFFV